MAWTWELSDIHLPFSGIVSDSCECMYLIVAVIERIFKLLLLLGESSGSTKASVGSRLAGLKRRI